VRDFGQSPFEEESRYRIGYSSAAGSLDFQHDQTTTKDAIRELGEFIEMNPASRYVDSAKASLGECRDKLAKKEFMNARFYEKTSELEAAIVYYKVVLDEYPECQYVPEAMLSMAEDLVKMNRTGEARDVLRELVDSNHSDETKAKAHSILARIGDK
jgi:outer membrane protein assembly factor BamD